MPAADSFVDTNVLLYAVSTEPSEAVKSRIAQNLLVRKTWVWSAQVAAEFVNAGTSPRRPAPLPLTQAERWIDIWLAFPLIPVDETIVKDAIRLARRYQISYFDAQIIAAAKVARCGTVYTEDLNHGQDYDGVRVVNPFVASSP